MRWIVLGLIGFLILSGCASESSVIASSIDNNGSSMIMKQYESSLDVSCGDVNAQFIAPQEFMCEVWDRCNQTKEFEYFGCDD